MTPADLNKLEYRLYAKQKVVRRVRGEFRAASKRAEDRLNRLIKVEGELRDIEMEVEVARRELPGVSTFKSGLSTTANVVDFDEARAAWRGANKKCS